jgi:hypothetical protein
LHDSLDSERSSSKGDSLQQLSTGESKKHQQKLAYLVLLLLQLASSVVQLDLVVGSVVVQIQQKLKVLLLGASKPTAFES